MKKIKLTIQYDGTAYHGWQTQLLDKTIQQTLQGVLSRILNENVTVCGSGRTDAGVHALGQVAHFVTGSKMDLMRMVRGVNSLLPPDIALVKAEAVPPDFHARYSARSRIYGYCIWNLPERSPFYQRYSWHIPQTLDVDAMLQAAHFLVGVHDFSSFQGADRKQVRPVREVNSVRLRKVRRHLLLFEITANAFLKHMVRNIVGTLVEVGLNKMTPDGFKKVLDEKNRETAGPAAPAHGLFLREVVY